MHMNIKKLSGTTVYLDLVEEKDAEFICSLRNNPSLNNFLSKSTALPEIQRQWIRAYKTREAENKEYYFIIHRKDNDLPIGTIRLYDFLEHLKSFCWGSWILNENKTPSAAIESALLIYRLGFEILGFEQSQFDVRKDNQKVSAFHVKLGAVKVAENDLDIFYVFPKAQYHSLKTKYQKFLASPDSES